MSQQFHNGGHHDGSKTVSIRDSYRYAVVNEPNQGKHKKPQITKYKINRKLRWILRNKLKTAIV